MHTATTRVSNLVSSAPGSPRKGWCESVIWVLGWGLPIFLGRLDFRPRAGALTCGCTHSDLILTNGTPGCAMNVGMILSTGRPEATVIAPQKSSAVALP